MTTIQKQQEIVGNLKEKFRHIKPISVQALQAKLSMRAPAGDGVWISQDSFTAPNDSNLSDLFHRVVEDMAPPGIEISAHDRVKLSSVPFEWLGRREEGPSSDKEQSNFSDEHIYRRICQEKGSGTIVLYAHGGAFFAGSPTFSRAATTKLALLTKGTVVSTAYRLAPQNPFPAAVLDLLMAWLSLVYPANDARHTAVSPDSVVLAGDSSGGNLCFALVQVIIRMQFLFKDNEILFNGKNITVPMPGGVATLSPYLDMSATLPSFVRNGHIDFLGEIIPLLRSTHIPDEVWPSKPPRGDPYCHPSAWTHSLVSPMVAKNWNGSPPLWIAVGEERLADGSKLLATEAARQGVPVVFSEYKGMPHVFPLMLNKLPQSQRCFHDWANACRDFSQKDPVSTKGTIINMPGTEHKPVSVQELLVRNLEEVKLVMKTRADQQKPWVPGIDSGAKL